MNTLEGILDYSRETFEEVKSSDIVPQNSWAITYNDEDTELNGKFLATRMAGEIKEDQVLATITLKVKKDVTDQTTTITVKDIATNDGKNLIEETDKTVDIEIKTNDQEPSDGNNINDPNNSGNQNETGNRNETGNNNGTGNRNETGNGNGTGTGNGVGSGNGTGNGNGAGSGTTNTTEKVPATSNGSSNKDNTTSSGKLPQTGSNNIFLVIGTVAIITLGIISYVNYKKYKKI